MIHCSREDAPKPQVPVLKFEQNNFEFWVKSCSAPPPSRHRTTRRLRCHFPSPPRVRLIVGAMPTGERSSQAQQKDILAAFKLFDKDDSGALDAKEFAAILTRPGETALSEHDAAEIIKEFDANGDGVLQFKEFAKAWGKLVGQITENSDYTDDMYKRRIEPHLPAINRLFDKLDKDKNGDLSGDEVEEIITVYQGEAYNHDDFMSWYDSHGGNADGTWDVTEFGWYIADCAECEESKMVPVMEAFEEAIDYVMLKRAGGLK